MLTDYQTVKISALPQVTSPQPTDELPMNNQGQTRKANPSQLSADYKSLAVMPTIEALGNRSYKLTFAGVDYSGLFSAGARLRGVRSVAAQVLSAIYNGTNQYHLKSGTINGLTFVDDFAAGGWIKLTAYPSSFGQVIGRYDGVNGFLLYINIEGTVSIQGNNGGSSNWSKFTTNQSVPLNRWVHIGAQLDMSAFSGSTVTSYVMIDGVDCTGTVTRNGSLPTTLNQTGVSLTTGANNNGSSGWFPGKMAQVFVSSAKITQVNMLTLYSQGLTPALIAANNIASAYSFDGNSNDLNTTNANNLTAQNGAASNTADGPFGIQAGGLLSSTVEFAIVQSNSYTAGNTIVYVQVPEGGALPTSGGLSALTYASVKAPYGFPTEPSRWSIMVIVKLNLASSGTATNTWYNPGGIKLIVPQGIWRLIHSGLLYTAKTNAVGTQQRTLSTSASAESDNELTAGGFQNYTGDVGTPLYNDKPVVVATQTPYYVLANCSGTYSSLQLFGSTIPTIARAENALL